MAERLEANIRSVFMKYTLTLVIKGGRGAPILPKRHAVA